MISEANIIVKGARVNNLKNIEVKIPHNKLVVITGLSGSGKSSLAFDTLYAEGRRRYVESLSVYVRQFLGKMNKPEVDFIQGLPPAIAINQKINNLNPRSTLATSTEIYYYLRMLFTRIGKTFSPLTGNMVCKHQTSDIIEEILQYPLGTRFILLTKINPINSRSTIEQLRIFMQEGFSRVEINGEIRHIHEIFSEKMLPNTMIYLLIDRLTVSNDTSTISCSRLSDSIETAFFAGNGNCILRIYTKQGIVSKEFSKRLEADGMVFEEPSDSLFNFNSPAGACPTCKGFGMISGISENLVVPNPSLSFYEDAIACWKGENMSQWKQDFIQKSFLFQFPIHCPYKKLTPKEKDLLWNGNESLRGIHQFFKYVEENSYKIQYKILYARYLGKTICPACQGKRLKSQALYVKIGGKNLADLMILSIEKIKTFFEHLQLSDYEMQVSKRLLIEIQVRLQFLNEVGLGYLTLDRLSSTLSGGESQRVNLTKALGNNLVGYLYILDEPSLGLHAKDTKLLIQVLKRLQKMGNTVVVVEHDEEIIRAADYMIDIGPDAGHRGGEIIYQGKVENQNVSTNSHTVRYLIGEEKINIPLRRRSSSHFIEIKGIRENNLKGFDVRFPLNAITVVTGVSGSGKSSLVYNGLYQNIKNQYENNLKTPSIFGDLNRIYQVEFVDQCSIGHSIRSNPVTYIKAYDEIRKLFANQPLSRQMQFTPSHFSFNTKGGRCEACKGEGIIRIEMQFMADVLLECESCHGKRFSQDILEIEYCHKNIYNLLNMTIDEAVDFFIEKENPSTKKIIQKLQTLQQVGLGYVKLGQSSTTLSGGENQRVKLAYHLSKEKSQPTLFIFDEPTTGLHFHDIKTLLKVFEALVDREHTIVIIEHHLDVIKMADYVIDLGPEGGENGGFLIAYGTPEEVATNKQSITGKFLKEKLLI